MKHLPAFLLLAILPLSAAPDPPRDLRVTNAIVFKNGLSFLTREGSLLFTAGQARVFPAPEALLGTLWISATGRNIDEVEASEEQHRSSHAATSVAALLAANPGKVATIRIGEHDYTGTLLPSPVESPAKGTLFLNNIRENSVSENVVLINIDGKTQAFDSHAVQSVSFAQPPSTSSEVAEARAVISLRSKGPDSSVPVSITYLRSGISWMPEYSIVLLDNNRARLSMQAMLINDGEDLHDTDVRFAVSAFRTSPSLTSPHR